MLSVIISARTGETLDQMEEYIQLTCGEFYEICAQVNADAQNKIATVYNECASGAKYPNLVFIHDDIYFKTENWGKYLIDVLRNTAIGIVGIAGAGYKPHVPGGWWSGGDLRGVYIDPAGSFYKNPFNDKISDVVVVDGCFIAMRKEVWQEFNFDETTYSGFHLYDLDICMQIRKKYRVCVIYDILIEHASDGSKNNLWIEDSIKFCKKWHNHLPAYSSNERRQQRIPVEYSACWDMLKWCKKDKYSSSYTLLPYLIKIICKNPVQIKNNLKLLSRFVLPLSILSKIHSLK